MGKQDICLVIIVEIDEYTDRDVFLTQKYIVGVFNFVICQERCLE